MKWLLTACGLLLAGALALSFWGWREWQTFEQAPLHVAEHGSRLEIEPGTSYRGLVSQLQSTGYTSATWPWRLLGKLEAAASQIKAGEYHIEPGTKPRQLLELLAAGRAVQYSFTIIEGRTFQETLGALQRHPQIKVTMGENSSASLMTELGSEWTSPEGAFLPETYQFPKGTSDLEFLRRAHRDLLRVLAEAWSNRQPDLPLKNAYEALILASIIEKETAQVDERQRIAGVFIRRLNKGMRLQTDPTVIYGMGANYDGNIRRRDLVQDTPYNTYTRFGLTPTPIAMASAAAISAALNPADGDELYFVAMSDGTGRHKFSATLADHERSVDRYQRGIR